MCLAVPGKIVSIKKDQAVVDYGIETRTAKLLTDDFKVNDYVIIQGGIIVIKVEKKEAEEGDLSDKLMLKLLENNTFEVPNRLVAYEVNELINQFEAKLKQQGMTLELAGVKTDDLVKQYRESAERRVRGDFVLKAIAKQESVTLSDEDIAQGFARIADEYGMTVDEVKKYFRKREELLPFMNEMLNEKILKLLREHAVITPVPAALVDTPSETESGAAA